MIDKSLFFYINTSLFHDIAKGEIMASKRRIRRKSCTSKKGYDTIGEAKHAIWQLRQSTGSRDWYNHYHCKFCKKIHIGHAKGSGQLIPKRWNLRPYRDTETLKHFSVAASQAVFYWQITIFKYKRIRPKSVQHIVWFLWILLVTFLEQTLRWNTSLCPLSPRPSARASEHSSCSHSTSKENFS